MGIALQEVPAQVTGAEAMGMQGRLRGRGGHWRGIERVIRQGDGHLRQPSTVFASKGPKVWGGEEEGEEG